MRCSERKNSNVIIDRTKTDKGKIMYFNSKKFFEELTIGSEAMNILLNVIISVVRNMGIIITKSREMSNLNFIFVKKINKFIFNKSNFPICFEIT